MWWVLMIDWSSDLIWADDEAIVSQLTIQLLFLSDTLGEKKECRGPADSHTYKCEEKKRISTATQCFVATSRCSDASLDACQLHDRGAGLVSVGSSSALFFLPWRPQRRRNVSGQKWGPCRGGGATAVAQPIHLWRRRRGKKQRGEDRWTGSVRGGQKLRSSRSSTFSLRFFAKRAEQKAEVRFLPFQRVEDRKWQYLKTNLSWFKAFPDRRTAVKIKQSQCLFFF